MFGHGKVSHNHSYLATACESFFYKDFKPLILGRNSRLLNQLRYLCWTVINVVLSLPMRSIGISEAGLLE
jgi:hypothetical protein